MQDQINSLYQKHDTVASRVSETETEIAVLKNRVTAMEKASNEQIIQQRVDVQRVIDILDSFRIQVNDLIAEKNRQEGASRAVKWIPTIIQVVVGITVIVAFVAKY